MTFIFKIKHISILYTNIFIKFTTHEYYHQFITNLIDAFKKISTIGPYGSFYNTHTLFVGMVSIELVPDVGTI